MTDKWTLEKLNSLISEGIEESSHLEYKSAGGLEKSDFYSLR